MRSSFRYAISHVLQINWCLSKQFAPVSAQIGTLPEHVLTVSAQIGTLSEHFLTSFEQFRAVSAYFKPIEAVVFTSACHFPYVCTWNAPIPGQCDLPKKAVPYANDVRTALKDYFSRRNVTGPSFVNWMSICSPNRPVSI
ncbi:hypothetical protein EV213_11174 [Aureibacillus halotolerans]|uniref:Uncharacterized protein n=1 Tax=Aureibacillus halotolerans TaxID=1508390 RepID=A0A4R6U123_9BACI|nr:hypothetical protein EV213_11174 [Aureibacillus halotolerans]